MSLVLIEGWDSLDDIGDVYEKYNSPVIGINIKRTGSQSSYCATSTNGYYLDLPSTQDTYIFGAALYVLSDAILSSTAGNHPIRFHTDSTYNLSISIGDNKIAVYNNTTQLGVTSNVYLGETWFYLEIKATCKNSISADEFIIKVNGVEVLNLAATTDTQYSANPGFNRIRLAGAFSGKFVYYDDIYVCDLLGGVNDDFLGDVKVETLYPDGNGNTNDFTGSDADSTNNYLLVNEPQQNGDTDYVEDSTPSNLDLYTYDDMSATPDTIFGVSTRSYAKKDDAGARTGKLVCRRTSTNYEGSEFSPSNGSYQGFDEIWEEDPSTSSAWVESGVNAAEFGVKVQS